MSRQHTAPFLIAEGAVGQALRPIGFASGSGAVSEADVQRLVQAHPASLPIAEVDPGFAVPVPICTELNTPAGPIDNFMITPTGQPVLVECKLWRNPEGRREVVGQILDYAKELSRWSSSDLQREVNKRLKRSGNAMLEIIRAEGHDVDEIAFNDALTRNLRQGRFLLLIVGDGIREGVEAIAEYLTAHAGLHFSLGLVELPIYQLPDGSRLVTPRILARTTLIARDVIALPDGFQLRESGNPGDQDREGEHVALGNEQASFWAEFLSGLKLDDPEQPIPGPSRGGSLTFMLPAPAGSSWLNVYRDLKKGEVGITLSYTQGTVGETASQAIINKWDEVQPELGGRARVVDIRGRAKINEGYIAGSLEDAAIRASAFDWLRERVNTYVNVLRPLVRSIAADID